MRFREQDIGNIYQAAIATEKDNGLSYASVGTRQENRASEIRDCSFRAREVKLVSFLFAIITDKLEERLEQLVPDIGCLPCTRACRNYHVEVGLWNSSGHSHVETGLTGWLEVMDKLLWRACRGQGSESYRRSFLVVLCFVIDDVEDAVLVLTLRSRREDGDYVVRFNMCPLGIWC